MLTLGYSKWYCVTHGERNYVDDLGVLPGRKEGRKEKSNENHVKFNEHSGTINENKSKLNEKHIYTN